MPDITLAAETGRTRGSRPSKRLRTEGKIPAVLYGHGTDPQSLAVNARELRSALSTEAGLNALLSLQVDGTAHLAMARDIQRHPVRNTVSHVDFVIVSRDEVVAVEVPVNLIGEAVEVHRADGVVEQQLFALTIHATPGNIPNSIEVDVSELQVGDSVRVGDLALPSGATTEVDPESPVVVAQAAQAAELPEEAAAAEAAEAAEAEAATAAAEGGAPPEGGGS